MKGKIDKMNAWKSGKGFFIGIAGTDYMFYGSPTVSLGDVVEFELGKPTEDGKQKIKKIALAADGIEAFIDKAETPVFRAHDAPRIDAREEYWKAKEKRDLEKEPIHIRLSCLESAAAFSASDNDVDGDGVVLIAKRFEKYAKTGE